MKASVVARITATRADGQKLIVEVHSDATFQEFYHFYTQAGARRSTKQPAKYRTVVNRNEGLYPLHRAYYITPGLDKIAEMLESSGQYQTIKFYVIMKRLYKKLINAPADEIGGGLSIQWRRSETPKPILRYPVRIPSNHTTIERKVSILLGRGR